MSCDTVFRSDKGHALPVVDVLVEVLNKGYSTVRHGEVFTHPLVRTCVLVKRNMKFALPLTSEQVGVNTLGSVSDTMGGVVDRPSDQRCQITFSREVYRNVHDLLASTYGTILCSIHTRTFLLVDSVVLGHTTNVGTVLLILAGHGRPGRRRLVFVTVTRGRGDIVVTTGFNHCLVKRRQSI